MVAVEEKNIRTNLSARTSVLLKGICYAGCKIKYNLFFCVFKFQLVLNQKIEDNSYDFNSKKIQQLQCAKRISNKVITKS
jgi:hypothetical protein